MKVFAFLVVFSFLLTSICFGPAVLAEPRQPAQPVLDFSPCPDAAKYPGLAGTLCGTVTAPLADKGAAAELAGKTVTLFVRKFPAPVPAKGTVWLVAGGPGESGASFYPFIDSLRRSFPGMDLLIPDHRGTGYSTRLCPAEEAADSPGGMALEGAEWGSCFPSLHSHGQEATQFTITNAAHDLKRLIEAVPDKKPVYLYGVSYGTQLVLRTLSLGNPAVRGVILDSLVPPQTGNEWDLSHRSQVVDEVGDAHASGPPATVTRDTRH